MAKLSKNDVVAVVGAGAMGAGIAQVAAVAGHPVKLFDAKEGVATQVVIEIQARINRLQAKGKLSLEAAEQACLNLSAVGSLDDFYDAALVIEAIVEDLSIKQQLFVSLESIVSGSAVLASNTSSISITAIASALQKPERLAGLHFFNPAPLMALVEVVQGLASDQEILETLFDTAKAWGKSPVYTQSTPGFIVNRVARPFYAEALRVRQEDAASIATIDACIKGSGGFRMGPFELMDMIGHDVNYAVTHSVWQSFYYDQRFLPSLLQQDLVHAGYLGKKAGRGFYDYRENAQNETAQLLAKQTTTEHAIVYGGTAAAKALCKRFTDLGIAFDHQASTDDLLMLVGQAKLYVSDGRSAGVRAKSLGETHILVLDLALDYEKASHIAVSASAQCGQQEQHNMVAALQQAGFSVALIKDIPGLLLMRTVAMLANEGADAVNQGVASAEGVDTAMRLGVNYPEGPLAWAKQIGFSHVVTVLENLAHWYGEDRYRVSPWLRNACLQKDSA